LLKIQVTWGFGTQSLPATGASSIGWVSIADSLISIISILVSRVIGSCPVQLSDLGYLASCQLDGSPRGSPGQASVALRINPGHYLFLFMKTE